VELLAVDTVSAATHFNILTAQVNNKQIALLSLDKQA
jgi:hypothetical protein